jgi:NADH-quinone oxidoreductase subunit H
MQLPFSLQPLFDFLGQFTDGPANALILVMALVKIALIVGGLLQVVPFIILFERKIISWVQDRPGPNRAGPWGLLHGILDGVKLFFKEEIMPKGVDKPLYLLAPGLVVMPAFLALCLLPVGPIISGPHLDALAHFFRIDPMLLGSAGIINKVPLAITNPNIGILYVLAITSVGVYGVTLAGWASNNKWSLLGGIRASAQMISYEITLSLSIIGVVLIAGSLNLYEIIDSQRGGFFNWNVVAQPVAFLLFIVAMFAETNRVPFDLAEAEPELTGGFHTEYSSMRFALFFLGEYINMVIVSTMCVTLFLGGFLGPLPLPWESIAASVSSISPSFSGFYPWIIAASYLIGPLVIVPAKVSFFIFLFIFARATLPRFRYDQLMNLGWKRLLPIGLINLVLTAIAVALDMMWTPNGKVELVTKFILGGVTLALFVGYDVLIFNPSRKRQLAKNYRLYDEKAPAKSPMLAS